MTPKPRLYFLSAIELSDEKTRKEDNECSFQVEPSGALGRRTAAALPTGSAFSGVRRSAAELLDALDSRDSTTLHIGTA